MHFTFILVEPKVPENIGASARAIKTMGFNSMRLVNPCDFLDGKAKWVAHGSYDILEGAMVFGSVEEAIGDMDLVIGTTARFRLVKQDYLPLEELKKTLKNQYESAVNVAIVFGREESGLTNEEIQLCDLTSSIPINQDFPSLNLSQAVMIYAYQLSTLPDRFAPKSEFQPDEMSVKALKNRVGKVLENIGIEKGSALFGRIMERVALAGDTDIKLLHSAATAIIKKSGLTEN